jgi:hypothetical protein
MVAEVEHSTQLVVDRASEESNTNNRFVLEASVAVHRHTAVDVVVAGTDRIYTRNEVKESGEGDKDGDTDDRGVIYEREGESIHH